MASGNTLLIFTPLHNEPPATNFANLTNRNGHPLLNFGATTQVAAIFRAVMPSQYVGGGVTVFLHWCAGTATSGTIGWDVAFERIGDGVQDLDAADSFATAQAVTDTTVPASSGLVDVTSCSFTHGAQMDDVAAGDFFRLRVRRNAPADSASGFAQLAAVEIRET